jgi:hypothetical protein
VLDLFEQAQKVLDLFEQAQKVLDLFEQAQKVLDLFEQAQKRNYPEVVHLEGGTQWVARNA